MTGDRRRPRSKRSPARTGWRGMDSYTTVVPGDVVHAMTKLGIHVSHVDDSGEAHAPCPAHRERLGREDRHPSFSVDVHSGVFGCWSCGFKGTFADLVAYVLSVDRADAVAWIRAQGTIRSVQRILAKKSPQTVDTTEEINEAKLALFTAPPPRALRSRKLTAEACERYGVLWDPKNGRWITTVRDEQGVLLGWQEKSKRFFRNRPTGLKKSRHLFGLWTLPETCCRIVLVESPLDAVRLASAGVEHAVASYGASVSESQLELIFARTHHLVLFLDNDAPGRQSRDVIISRLRGMGRGLSTVDYRLLSRPTIEGLDPGDLEDDEVVLLARRPVPAVVASLFLQANPN